MLDIEINNQAGMPVIRLSGVIDGVTSNRLSRAFDYALENHCEGLMVDCAHVRYITSSGIRVLFNAVKRFDRGNQVSLVEVNDLVADMLTISGMKLLVNIERLGDKNEKENRAVEF